ncbi:alpha/beta fold hydrolase [Paractinoplanes globisporus]|uniref:Alpha/beta fold hydrolase n=1 Tax=Paractinoplanes globisporus TaxID=113565 RepID=A0ABW6WW56_9ACTN|nr:alpha/beta hydrolase [Actinoplanes globisporus]
MRTTRWGRAAVLGAAVAAAAGALVVRRRVVGYVDPWMARVASAGFVAQTAKAAEVTFSYAEGPASGPPLVLLHAQHMDWFSYSRVLPALARRFHVFAVTYPGHGATTVPDGYPMTANRIGADLAALLEETIGEPAYVSGNSSGGLLTAWLAANRPDLVRAVLLEDPPLFSAEYSRIRTTIADRSFATCAAAVREGTDDFLLYWIHSNKRFFANNVAPGAGVLLARAVRAYRRANPGRPVEIGLLPNDTVRLFLRGMDQFDPRFGAAFHDGTWHHDFDHAKALARIACPALLVQANFAFLPDGTLNGAMTREDADRAMALLPRATYRRVDATHVVHLADPELFVSLVESLASAPDR